MIYDAFLYNGEKELLEIRLNEFMNCRAPVSHVLIEANKTFTGKDKPLYFEECKEEFEEWPIMSVSVMDMPETSDPWEREKYQRNMIAGALRLLIPRAYSTIIISDVDEIPSSKVIDAYHTDMGFMALILDKYAYYFNQLEERQSWDRARIMPYEYLTGKTPEEIRNSGYPAKLENAGWHWSWCGRNGEYKLDSFSHQELNTNANVQKARERENFWNDKKLETVLLDNSFPQYLIDNKEKFKHLIK